MAKLVHMPTANDECAQKYQEVKGGKCRAVFFKLTDDEKEIVVEKTIEKGEDYSSFTKSFPDNDIRWCLLDFSYRTTNGGIRNKLTFLSWVPDSLKRDTLKESVRVKSSGVLYVGALKKIFKEIAFSYQANDQGDLDQKLLLDKVSKHEKDPIDCITW